MYTQHIRSDSDLKFALTF